MKKVLAISSVLIGVVFLAGCSHQPVSQTQPMPSAPVAQAPAQPAPTTPQVIEKTPQEIISGLLKEDAYKKDKAITILKSNSDFILASISAKPGATIAGYMLWAAKVNGGWKNISENNSNCDKKLLTGHSFPQEWIAEHKCI